MPYLAFIGPTEWLVIGGVLLLLFGGRKLPELARAMGRSITEFKGGLKGDDEPERLEKGSDAEAKPGQHGRSAKEDEPAP